MPQKMMKKLPEFATTKAGLKKQLELTETERENLRVERKTTKAQLKNVDSDSPEYASLKRNLKMLRVKRKLLKLVRRATKRQLKGKEVDAVALAEDTLRYTERLAKLEAKQKKAA